MSGFELFLDGSEVPKWRNMLTDAGSPMGFSYKGIESRGLPKTKKYLLAERFSGEIPMLLNSGAYSFNRAQDTTSLDELRAFAERYEAFIEANLDHVKFVSEFDCMKLGREWIVDRRKAFYNHLPPEKLMVVWHEEFGIEALLEDARRYEVLGVTEVKLKNGVNLQSQLNGIARSGVHLHGVALTQPDILTVIPFSSASSTSWTSPLQYGDFIVWDGRKLHRYPRDYRDRAQRQHASVIKAAGFDPDAIVAGNKDEITRFTIWCWQQQATAIDRLRKPRPRQDPFSTSEEAVTVTGDPQNEDPNSQLGGVPTVTGSLEARNSLPVARESRVVLPIMGVTLLQNKETTPDGDERVIETSLFRMEAKSRRVCSNCYLAEKCPEYQDGSECVYDIPISGSTREQRKALLDGMVEMQTQRVLLGKFAEDLSGGMPDPNLSTELDRLFKLIAMQKEIEDDRDSFEMTVRAKGNSSRIANIFGGEAPPRHGQSAAAAPTPLDPVGVIEGRLVPAK